MSVFQVPPSRFTIRADAAAVFSLLPQPLNASAAPNAATVKNFFMLRCPFRLLFLAPPGRSQLLHFLSDRERACIKISMGCTPKAARRLYVQEHSATYSGYRCTSLLSSEERRVGEE